MYRLTLPLHCPTSSLAPRTSGLPSDMSLRHQGNHLLSLGSPTLVPCRLRLTDIHHCQCPQDRRLRFRFLLLHLLGQASHGIHLEIVLEAATSDALACWAPMRGCRSSFLLSQKMGCAVPRTSLSTRYTGGRMWRLSHRTTRTVTSGGCRNREYRLRL